MKIKNFFTCVLLLFFFLVFVNAAIVVFQYIDEVGERAIISNGFNSFTKEIETRLNDKLVIRKAEFEINGLFHRLIDKRYLYNRFKLSNGHFVTRNARWDLTEPTEKTTDLFDFCQNNGTEFLYVNLPTKNENDYIEEYGIKSYTGESADAFIANLQELNIPVLDMRKYLVPEDDPMSIYYKTDHHWTVSAGFQCARILAEKINELFGLNLDTQILNPENFRTEHYEKYWSGEDGRKASIAYSGLEDFDLITPIIPTRFHLTIPVRKLDKTGDFSVMLNDWNLKTKDLYERRVYYTYLYGNDPIQTIDNLDNKEGRILIIKDSFAQVVNPFLAMTADELISWDVRYTKESVKKYISENPVDLVIILYNEADLGYKSNQTTSMFNFEGLPD